MHKQHLTIAHQVMALSAGQKVMSKLPRKPRKLLSYPGETSGSKLAAEMRKKVNKLSADQKNHYVRKALALTYGENGAKTVAGAGR
jgi:hypothetical protein